jgi:curli production assembly/transport component CsgE
MSLSAALVAMVRPAGAATLLLAVTGLASAQDIDRGVLDERALPGLEQRGGVLVDRTITHFGAEFVRQFAAKWRDIRDTAGMQLTIVERPSARYGSVIYVQYRQRAIARVFLYAGRKGAILPLADATVRYVAERTRDEALGRVLFRDPDLAMEELQ